MSERAVTDRYEMIVELPFRHARRQHNGCMSVGLDRCGIHEHYGFIDIGLIDRSRRIRACTFVKVLWSRGRPELARLLEFADAWPYWSLHSDASQFFCLASVV